MLLETLKPIRRVYEARIRALIFINCTYIYLYIAQTITDVTRRIFRKICRSLIKSDRELVEHEHDFLDLVSSTRYVDVQSGQDRRDGKEKEKKETSVEEWNGERTLLFWPLK